LDDALVFPSNLSEAFFQLAAKTRKSRLAASLENLAFALYDARARLLVRRKRPALYHYRACFGQKSALAARSLGIPLLCDHSIAHPQVLPFMTDNKGACPLAPLPPDKLPPLHKRELDDIALADWLQVNSDFVRDTCVFCGFPKERIRVIYLGVDEAFFQSVPAEPPPNRAENPALFAGSVCQRKGVDTLIAAHRLLGGRPKINIAGKALPGDPVLEDFNNALSDNFINNGIVPREQLAARMSAAPIFLFPSYCEGSARVIFEAMACGCYIITTPNAGSIVRDGVHGALVPPGDAPALATAWEHALNNMDKTLEIGRQNAREVRENHRQWHYVEKTVSFYNEILAGVH
ncbi:MAG: glycosyltransferase, partial [Opitutaceae bacterium]|nr:glycosyltransferase [Opitutaceae bacterium]